MNLSGLLLPEKFVKGKMIFKMLPLLFTVLSFEAGGEKWCLWQFSLFLWSIYIPKIVLAKDFLQVFSKTRINKLDFGPFPLINFT